MKIFNRCKGYLLVTCLILIAGCAYSHGQLPSVLTSDDIQFVIPKGTPFTAIQDAGQTPKQYVVKDDDLLVTRKGEYQKLLEENNTKWLKKVRATKKQMMWGGGVTSLLGIIATVFWNSRRKFKIDGNIKAEA